MESARQLGLGTKYRNQETDAMILENPGDAYSKALNITGNLNRLSDLNSVLRRYFLDKTDMLLKKIYDVLSKSSTWSFI